jgi:hypothetical protein
MSQRLKKYLRNKKPPLAGHTNGGGQKGGTLKIFSLIALVLLLESPSLKPLLLRPQKLRNGF